MPAVSASSCAPGQRELALRLSAGTAFMAGHGLLTRIRHSDLAVARRAVSDEEIRASILENLRAMCGTRLGSSPACPTYGILPMSDVVHSCPDALALVSATIKSTIIAYETRLVQVVVRALPLRPEDPLTLRFEITGTMMNAGRKVPVKFQTVVDANRRVDVV